MPKCSFCKQGYEFPKGITVVQKDGTPLTFCSSKCRKNSEMGRDNRKTKWVKKSDVAKEEAARRQASKEERARMAAESKK